MESAYFIIHSRGRTATQWIAAALSSIDGVFCSHGHDPDPFNTHRDATQKLSATHGNMASGPPPVDVYFDMLEAKPFNAYGNVHGYGLGEFERRAELSRAYRFCQITRDPVDRAYSFAARWKYVYDTFDFRRDALSRQIADLGGADMSVDDGLFALATSAVVACGHDLKTGVPVFRYEDITQEPNALRALVESMTDADCAPERLLSIQAIDPRAESERHSRRRASVIAALETAGCAQAYRALGYAV